MTDEERDRVVLETTERVLRHEIDSLRAQVASLTAQLNAAHREVARLETLARNTS